MTAPMRLAQLRYDAMEPPDDDARDAALAVVRDGRCWRTLYRSRHFHPLPFGVLR